MTIVVTIETFGLVLPFTVVALNVGCWVLGVGVLNWGAGVGCCWP